MYTTTCHAADCKGVSRIQPRGGIGLKTQQHCFLLFGLDGYRHNAPDKLESITNLLTHSALHGISLIAWKWILHSPHGRQYPYGRQYRRDMGRFLRIRWRNVR